MNSRKSLSIFLVFCLVFISASGVSFSYDTAAENTSDYLDDFEDSEDISDFEDSSDSVESETETTTTEKPEKSSIFNFKGDITLFLTENIAREKPEKGETDWRGISKIKSELFLELDTDLPLSWKMKISGSGFYDAAFSINDRDEYSDEILDEDEKAAELRKAYISGNITGGLDIKAGRQILVWGKSDTIRVTDVINPINMKTPFMTDLEDIRLPVLMTKLDYYLGEWNLSAILVHEKRFNKLPEYGSDYYFYGTKLSEKEPSENLPNTEYALSLSGSFTGWDASLYYADFYDKTPYFKIISFFEKRFELRHSHQTMVGADINIALGNFLLKSEIAQFKSVDFSDYLSLIDTIYFRREIQKPYSVLKSLGGIEYTGFKETTISLELMNTHIEDIDAQAIEANIRENTWETAIRINRTFLNEKFDLTLLTRLYGKNMDEGSVFRISAACDLTDNFIITGGGIFYDGNKMLLLKNIKDNDRLYTNFEYSF